MFLQRFAGLACALVILSGCSTTQGPVDTTAPSTPVSASGDPQAHAEAPHLTVGQSWTYTTGGFWDTVPRLTIVVAQTDPQGFLFAAASREQLEDEIAWDLPYLGRMDMRLRAMQDEKYGGKPLPNPLLDLPLHEGKTWTYHGLPIKAERANITVMGGGVQGWRVQGEDERRRVLVEYAESVGYVSRYEDVPAALGRPSFALTLVEQGTSQEWTWFKRGAEVVETGLVGDKPTPSPKTPSVVEVTDSDDIVFVWALGSTGSRGVVAPPNGQEAWTFEGAGESSIRKKTFTASKGSWRLTGAPAPNGYVYMQGHALEFVTGP